MSNEAPFKSAVDTAVDDFNFALDSGAKAPARQGYYDRPADSASGQLVLSSTGSQSSSGGEFGKGFGRSFAEIPGLVAGLGAYAADIVGADTARDAMLKYTKQREEYVQQNYGSQNASFSDVWDGKADPWEFLKNASGYVTGQAIQSLVTGGIGSFAVKSMAKKGLIEAGEKVAAEHLAKGATAEAAREETAKFLAKRAAELGVEGFSVGAGAQNLTMEIGSIYPEAVAQAQKEGRQLDGGDLARIGLAGTAAAGVDTAMEAVNLGKVLKGSKAPGSIVGRAAREVPESVLRESGTEGVQTALERYGAGQSLNDQEAWRDYIDSMAVGAIGGAQAGSLASLHKRADETPAPNPLQHVADKAAEPNSPLSKAAMAGNPGATQAGNGSTQTGNDGIAQRVAAAISTLESTDTLQKLRELGPKMGAENLTNDFLYALQVARDPRNRQDVREQAMAQVEQAMQWATTGFTPGTPDKPGTSLTVPNTNTAVGPVGQSQFFDPNTIDGEAVRVDNMLPGPKALPGPQRALTTQEAPVQEQASPEAGATASPAEQQNVAPETTGPSIQKAAADAGVSGMAEVTAPRVSIPEGGGTAANRKRGAVVKQLAENGFGTVLREGKDFWMVNQKTGQKFKLDGPADAQLARKAIKDANDSVAHTSPNSPLNDQTPATQGQIDAGNYKKPPAVVNGVTLRYENPQGSTRSGVDENGKSWSVVMQSHYGHDDKVKGADGDGLDWKVGDSPSSPKIFVVDQINPNTGKFDEHKVIGGARTEEEARNIYLRDYEPGWKGLGAITEITKDQYDEWTKSGKVTEPFALGQKNFQYIYDNGVRKPIRRINKSELPTKVEQRKDGKPQKYSQEVATAIEQLAALLGKKVQFFESVGDTIAEGFVFPGNANSIFVNTQTRISPLAIFGHEFFHTLKQTNPKAWEAIASVLRERVTDAKGFRDNYSGAAVVVDINGKQVKRFGNVKDAEKFVAESGRIDLSVKQNSNDSLNENELEELVSDLGGNLMTEQKFWSEVLSKIREQNGEKAKGIIQKMIDTFNQFISKVFSGMSHGVFRAEKFINKEDFEKVRSAFATAVAEYMANGPEAEQGPIEESVKKSTPRPEERPEGLTLEGYHFSKAPRQVLNSAMYGTGLKGSARDEIKQQGDERLKHRISFYVNKGTGISPEAGVGGIAHKATLNNVYDADADLLRLKGGSARDFEAKVLDNGYDGYLNRMDGTQSGQVIMLGKRTITPEILGSASKITDAQATPAPAKREQDLADRITDNKSLPSGQLSPERWSQVLMSQDPELAAQMLDIGALTGDKSLYKDELARKVRELSGQIKKSTERAQSEYEDVVAKYKDTPEWMKAPNGNKTNLSERQWVQVRTPKFKKWFGDWEKHARAENPVGSLWSDDNASKAVDLNGEPMVVYHGTDLGGFMAFDEPTGKGRGDLGIWTTDDLGMAKSYVHRGRANMVENPLSAGYLTPAARQQPGVYALFVNIRNPYESDFEGANWDGERHGMYQVRDENDELIYDKDGNAYFSLFDDANQVALANPGSEVQSAESHYETTDGAAATGHRDGNDGVVIHNVTDNGGGYDAQYDEMPHDIFVAFNPTQVKSADFNNGEFKNSTSDIRKSTERSAEDENRMAVVVGGKPGEFNWNFTRNDLAPPPIQAPTQFGPRLEKIGSAVQKILSAPKFGKFAEDAFGIKGLKAVSINGSWELKAEPSYALVADEMTYEQATELSKLLGFAFAQDATVVYQPKAMDDMAGTPAAYVGNDTKLTKAQLAKVLKAAQDVGLDYSTTQDGKAVKFLYFGPSEHYFDFLDKVWDIKESSGLKYSDLFFVRSDLNEADKYVTSGDGSGGKAAWLSDRESGSSGLFGRAVDSLLVPYAKAVGAEGYRFAVQRFADKFGLNEAQRELIRDALIPKNGSGKSTVAIASGEEQLDITPTGGKGKTTVVDILWALQNRSAKAGLIEPGDYSPRAQKVIAEAMAEEVIFHLERPHGGKSAIGWYDTALKAAKKDYQTIFPELATDPDAEMLFDAIWGITSQGNDVFSNSVFGARVYNLVREGKNTLPSAVRTLRGTFGGETRAIENNLLKLHELIERNGYDSMRKFFNTKGRVSDINSVLRKDTTLYYSGTPLQVEGKADQIVTGWMVFGPKIGSFINNLHGDYSTLTADLWFSRTWNRILGYSFVHSPALEADQYQKFISALVTEYSHAQHDFMGPVAPKAVKKSGAVLPQFGHDSAALTRSELEEVIANPYKALELATQLESKFRKGGYKVKSDLRRAAKVWVENRETAVAAPRTDLERSFQQDAAEMVQKIVRRRTGQTITIADIQAALWFYEKDDLFGPLGGTNKKSEGADYAGAADEMLRVYQRGNLYYNKTDKAYVLGERGSYLENFDPHQVNDASAVFNEYKMDPVAGASFKLEDDGDAIQITATKDLERTPDVLKSVIDRLTAIARDRDVELSIEPKTPRNWKLRSQIESILADAGFEAQDEDTMVFDPSKAASKETAEPSYNQRVQALQDLISCLK